MLGESVCRAVPTLKNDRPPATGNSTSMHVFSVSLPFFQRSPLRGELSMFVTAAVCSSELSLSLSLSLALHPWAAVKPDDDQKTHAAKALVKWWAEPSKRRTTTQNARWWHDHTPAQSAHGHTGHANAQPDCHTATVVGMSTGRRGPHDKARRPCSKTGSMAKHAARATEQCRSAANRRQSVLAIEEISCQCRRRNKHHQRTRGAGLAH